MTVTEEPPHLPGTGKSGTVLPAEQDLLDGVGAGATMWGGSRRCASGLNDFDVVATLAAFRAEPSPGFRASLAG